MCHGRPLLAGLGWAATLGGLALCVLILLSAFLAFDDDHAPQRRNDGVVRLHSRPEAVISLARPGRRAIPAPATTPPPLLLPPPREDTMREGIGLTPRP